MLQSETVKKYDKYKDSGIEWIGEIPQHWEVRKLKTIGDYRNGLTYSPEDMCEEEQGTLVLRSSNIKQGKLVLNDNVYVNVEISDNLKVKKGDILICSRNGSRELIGKNAIINDDINASFGAFMMILRCNCPKYMYYILNSYIFNYYLGSFFTSTINQLTGKNFGGMDIVFCPCSTEQEEIVNYLDKKCGEIDRVVETEKSVIEKLKEYKQSIITEAVTKGLDKSAPLKDSGIEWIGKIPQHWETCKLLKLYKERKCKNKGNIETNVLSLSYGNIKKRNVENNMGLLPESFETYNIIVPDNIVLRLTDLQNDHRSLRCGLVKEQGIITSAYVTLEKKLDNISSNYYYRLLHTFDIMKGFYGMGDGVRQNLKYDGELCNLLVVRPPYAEQQQIAEYLDNKCSEIDKAIADKEQVIEKFIEYKKSLIYECVTGKRKVAI